MRVANKVGRSVSKAQLFFSIILYIKMNAPWVGIYM